MRSYRHGRFGESVLLHEEFQKENPRVERMTRHLYDLERLMDTDFGKAALADPRMYAEIVKHRSIFNTIRGVDYRMHHPSRIDFIPPENWRRYGAGIMSGCRSISSMEIRCHTID